MDTHTHTDRLSNDWFKLLTELSRNLYLVTNNSNKIKEANQNQELEFLNVKGTLLFFF